MKISCALIFSIISSVCLAQSLDFDIVSKNKVMGSLSVVKSEANSITKYEIASKIDLVFGIDYKYSLVSVFKNGVLQKSDLKSYINDKPNSLVLTSIHGHNSSVSINGKTQFYRGLIYYNEASMYFQEPLGRGEIYSDFLGVNKTVKKIDDETYEVMNVSNQRISTYYYKSGVLESVTVDFGIIEFSLQRQYL
ncbi:MAG: hypothetical protein ACJASQ_000104 [Crocinitomicaceae bacterium]|jgi:hypothetical protein